MKVVYALPKKRLANAELAALYPGWTDEKIRSKTGIAARHIAESNETALDLAEKAARALVFQFSLDVKAIDFVLLCTQSPDYKLPTSACLLQDRLGVPKTAGALDYNLGCSGYIYGLSLAKGLVASGAAQNVLLVTSETYSKYIHPMDKSVRTIFGDGAAATLVDKHAVEDIGAFAFGTDGGGAKNLIVRTGGAREAYVPDAKMEGDTSGNQRTKNHLFMNGVEIFNFTLEIVPQTIKRVLEGNKLTAADIDLYVFHQANLFMLNAIRKVNRIPSEKFYIDMEDVGNTVSSTIPIALARAEAKGILKAGMRVMVMGFGVGLSWGATILTWR